jgi:hypothetical protein
MIEGSLEVKLQTIWTDEKQSRAEAERRERLEESRFTTTNLSYSPIGFLFLKLPPPPCAVLLV